MACCHHVCTTVSGLVIHFTLNFLKEAMGAALPRQSQTLLLSKPTFKCLLLPMLRRPNTFCYETCFWFIHCFFSRALNTCIVCRRTWTLCIAKTPWLQKCLFFFFQFLCPKYIVLEEEMVICCLHCWQLCGKLPKYQLNRYESMC